MKAINYGVVDFKTITDKRLSIHARGIYCYLACYANKSHTAFPSRERILSELGLSKNGYYKHYHQLEDNGIMLIERSQCKNNKYHLFFRKLIEKYKFGFAYKKIMTDPNISLAAKTVFVYITSYCPKGKIWYFKKSDTTEELGVSAYVLNRALKELSALELIDMTVSQYEISIMNMYDSSEKEGHESSNIEDITAEKGGHETPKKEDTEVKKEGHDLPTNEDREQYNSYNYNFYQSSPISHTEEDDEKDGQLKVGMSEEDIKELVDTEISTDNFRKHNYYYFIIVLTKYQMNISVTGECVDGNIRIKHIPAGCEHGRSACKSEIFDTGLLVTVFINVGDGVEGSRFLKLSRYGDGLLRHGKGILRAFRDGGQCDLSRR